MALKSMANFREKPINFKVNYSLYLVRKTEFVTSELINKLYQSILAEGLIISFERLFKGFKKALVVFGPVHILSRYSQIMGLLELEDYTKEIDPDQFLFWEMGSKEKGVLVFKENLSLNAALHNHEQLWWQVVLQPVKGGLLFNTAVRAAVVSSDNARSQALRQEFSSVNPLVMLPQLKTNSQLAKIFRERSISSDEAIPVSLDSVVYLLLH